MNAAKAGAAATRLLIYFGADVDSVCWQRYKGMTAT